MSHTHICEFDDSSNLKEKLESSEETLFSLSDKLKLISDRTRMKILYCLLHEDMNVCAIANLLSATHSSISHQLSILRNAKIVTFKKQGKNVVYCLKDEQIKELLKSQISYGGHSNDKEI